MKTARSVLRWIGLLESVAEDGIYYPLPVHCEPGAVAFDGSVVSVSVRVPPPALTAIGFDLDPEAVAAKVRRA